MGFRCMNSIEMKAKRKTFYADVEVSTALDLYRVYENKNKSEIVAEALKKYIPEKFFKMAQEKIKEENK